MQWQQAIIQCQVTYDEVLLYEQNQRDVASLKIADKSLFLQDKDVVVVLNGFYKFFDQLNFLLLWYIENKWCSFPSLIEEYGIHLPAKVQDIVTSQVSFPDQEGQHYMQQLGTPILPYVDGCFKLGCDISLRLHKDMTFNKLSILVQEVKSFQQPLREYHNALVVFKNEGTLFKEYLQNYLDSQAPQDDLSSEFSSPSSFSSSPVAITKHEESQEISMETFVSGLEHANALILHVMAGSATYSEITAGDVQMLKDLDIETEFTILSRYAKLSGADFSGESGLKAILELPQYAICCENIKNVCEQYHLTSCLKDSSFMELMKIVEESSSVIVRSKMTPNEAKLKMDKMKEILCLTEKSGSKHLKIFEALMDSAPFYQFVNEKNFYGKQGQDLFLQKYQLITAQLQHEDYDEQVLNQLKPAFKIISPFMNSEQTFTQLMTAVTNLVNPVDDLTHLEVVNTNIMTIQKWFSRAEVSRSN